MPHPATSDLPIPKSWDEFEDICSDILKRMWNDPYVVRNGRSGQKQHGVDTYGRPARLPQDGTKSYAGAQCKRTDAIDFKVIEEEVEKAAEFEPTLVEYLMMTTSPRDQKLQTEVRNKQWPFNRVNIMFWDDISLELSGHDDLLKKHFPGWFKQTTSEDDVLSLIMSSEPNDFTYDDCDGVFFLKSDVNLSIVFERGDICDRGFDEPWVKRFPDKNAYRQPVYIKHNGTKIKEELCVQVDGARYIMPLPKSASDLTLSAFRYHLGRILNDHTGYDFDEGLQRAGISVLKE